MGKDWRPKSSSNISTPAVREHGSSPKPNAKATTDYKGYYAGIDSMSAYYKHNMELLDKEVRDELFGERDIYTNGKYVKDFISHE